MDTHLRIQTPFMPPAASPQRTAPPSRPSMGLDDGYAGSTELPVDLMPSRLASAAAPSPPPSRLGLLARLTLAAATVASGLAGVMACASAPPPAVPSPPATSISATSISATSASATTARATETAPATLSQPSRPLPDNADVDAGQWASTSESAFSAHESGDAAAFLRTTSEDGVWIRGLQGGPRTSTGHVYMTHEELARDVNEQGPFSRQFLHGSPSGRFVITPDAQGRVQTILLD